MSKLNDFSRWEEWEKVSSFWMKWWTRGRRKCQERWSHKTEKNQKVAWIRTEEGTRKRNQNSEVSNEPKLIFWLHTHVVYHNMPPEFCDAMILLGSWHNFDFTWLSFELAGGWTMVQVYKTPKWGSMVNNKVNGCLTTSYIEEWVNATDHSSE